MKETDNVRDPADVKENTLKGEIVLINSARCRLKHSSLSMMIGERPLYGETTGGHEPTGLLLPNLLPKGGDKRLHLSFL